MLSFLFLLLGASNTYGASNTSAASQPYVWPLPTQFTVSNTLNLNVDQSKFQFTQTQSTKSQVITNAFTRYTSLTFPHTPSGSADNSLQTITGLSLTIKDPSDTTLGYGMDESYVLSLTTSGGIGTLNANTVWGALRGLETFSQLVIFNATLNFYQTYVSSITDSPRFSHRGILIDTSRHFQSKQSIMNVLDSMSYAKFNVLHWHVTDSQSLPYESLVYPKLWDASYTMYERFIQNDIKDIINYAHGLGIRVIPEFDMPGHAQSWCKGYPEICPSPSCQSPLNPATNATWDLLTGLIGEAAKLFMDDHMHLGGDEVNTNCWTKTPSIETWMQQQGYTPIQALQYFDERVIDIANSNGKTVIDWDEVFSNFEKTLDPKKVIIQVWHSGNSLLPSVVAGGFRGIFSPDPNWYLDSLKTTWEQRYVVEPLQYISNTQQQKLVIGGEGCMWGETVDVSDIQQTIWPTAAAVAERLWSPREINSTTAATPRMEYFRCLLNERGIAAAPPKNAQARSAPPGPGSCYYQRRR
eukprot:736924_1